MGALSTRAYIDGSVDSCLCPLSFLRVPYSTLSGLLPSVFQGTQALAVIYNTLVTDDKDAVAIAEGYEYSVAQETEQDQRVYASGRPQYKVAEIHSA